MKRVMSVLPIMAAATIVASCGADGRGGPQGVAVGGAGFVPLSEMQSLPEGHPPLPRQYPTLPQGHPPLPWQHPALPEGHPPLYESHPECPAGERVPQPPLERHPDGQLRAHGLIST